MSVHAPCRAKQSLVSRLSCSLLAPLSRASYFSRLRGIIPPSLYATTSDMSSDGIYLWKRPVRAEGMGALLGSSGSVFHHVIVYVRRGDSLIGLEFSPHGLQDATSDAFAQVPAAPILREGAALELPPWLALDAAPSPSPPAPKSLLLHVRGSESLALTSAAARRALGFLQAQRYSLLRTNCMSAADFLVRVLTLGRARNAPLAYDLLVGQVPAQDSPMVALMTLTLGLSWFEVCTGDALCRAFVAAHGRDWHSGGEAEGALLEEAEAGFEPDSESQPGPVSKSDSESPPPQTSPDSSMGNLRFEELARKPSQTSTALSADAVTVGPRLGSEAEGPGLDSLLTSS